MGDYYGNNNSSNNNNSGAGRGAAPGSSLQYSDANKIFVGGLSWQTTEESLRWHFEQYGQVISVEVMRDRVTGVFAEPNSVDLVMADKDKHEVNHKLVDVKRAQARGVAPPSIHENKQQSRSKPQYETAETSPEHQHAKVFVGGIPPFVDRDELKKIFARFGTVVDSIVMLDQATQRSRCFGFVTFGGDPTAAAASAQASIDAQPLQIHGRSVEVKLATPRAEPARASNLPPAPKHLGLRAGQATTTSGEFAGLAVAYGRSGWKAGYGTRAFGASGWGIWEDTMGSPPEKAGFSFSMVDGKESTSEGRPSKRAKQ